MSEPSPQELEDIKQRYHKLLTSQQTLMLSTASSSGNPDISYAPFIRNDLGVFYIFVSEMARHTNNLLTNPQASILFIRPEAECNNLFARERAVINCSVKEIPKEDKTYPLQLDALQDKFGEVVALLRSLSDFHLFALEPQNGRYIIGFGRAFTLDVNNDSLLPI
jgi:putative heme iron utilization protein